MEREPEINGHMKKSLQKQHMKEGLEML